MSELIGVSNMCKKLVCMIFIAVFANLTAGATEPELVVWLEFNEGSGMTVADSSGHGNAGTLNNMDESAWVEGKIGGGLRLDGKKNYITIKHNPSLDITEAMTLATWIYWNGGSYHSIRIITKGNQLGLSLTTTSKNRLGFQGGWGGGAPTFRYINYTSVPSGEWVHLALTYAADDAEHRLRAYVNGDFKSFLRRASGLLGTNTDDLTIGNHLNLRRGFNGVIDDVRIYNRVLSEAELCRLPGFGVPVGAAVNPTPLNKTIEVSSKVILTWSPGEFAQKDKSHNIYFGTDFDAVNNADISDSSGIYRGTKNLGSETYTCERLRLGNTYYWRIDEVNEADSKVYKGLIWNFRTGEPGLAYKPEPSDSVANIELNKELRWQAGKWAVGHDVYFGTNPKSMSRVSLHQRNHSFVPDALAPDTTYYWRIDEFDGLDTHEGILWKFTTESAYAEGDLNRDRYVDSHDVQMLISQWHEKPADDEKVKKAALLSLLKDWSPPRQIQPYPADELAGIYQKAAKYILEQTPNRKKGRCVVFGAGRGRLAYELAKRTEFRIIGVEENLRKVNTGRIALEEANMYGDRITLHAGSLDNVDYSNYAAAVVVSDSIIEKGKCVGSAAEMYRMIRPEGGIAILGQPKDCPNKLNRSELEKWLDGATLSYTISEDSNGLWAHVSRGPLAGAGEWTHMWADPGNTGCSGDTRITDSRNILWFGKPGPGVMENTHSNSTPPLYKNGKLIIAGNKKDGKFICVDAYNGAELWELDIPGGIRKWAQQNAGGVAVDDNYFYVVAQEKCHKIDIENGKEVRAYQVPTNEQGWGYLAVVGDLLIGSVQNSPASSAKKGIASQNNSAKVTSRSLFCLNKNTGSSVWVYDNNSIIANPAICVSEDAVYFLETYAPEALSNRRGHVSLSAFTAGDNEHLVKLDKKTGKCLWRIQKNFPFRHVMYLSCSDGKILASGCSSISRSFWYHLYAFNAADGSIAWEKNVNSYQKEGSYWDSHGGRKKHPMIIGDKVYLKFGSFDLHTGKSIDFTFISSDCSDFSSSKNYIFGRNNRRANIYNLNEKRGTAGNVFCSETRPGCFLTIIPAGGLIMLPPYNSGCVCDFSIQSTICWLPE